MMTLRIVKMLALAAPWVLEPLRRVMEMMTTLMQFIAVCDTAL